MTKSVSGCVWRGPVLRAYSEWLNRATVLFICIIRRVAMLPLEHFIQNVFKEAISAKLMIWLIISGKKKVFVNLERKTH